MSQPFFFDPSQRRAWYAKRVGAFLLVVLTLLGFNVLLSIFLRPLLPLPPQLQTPNPWNSHKYTSHKSYQTFLENEKKLNTTINYVSLTGEKKEKSDVIDVFGFYVERDDASFESLKQNLPSLDTLIPERLTLTDTGIGLLDSKKMVRTLSYVHKNKENIVILPLINNYNGEKNIWDSQLLHTLLSDNVKRKTLEDHLLNFVQTNQLDGVSIDFEEVQNQTHPYLLQFIQELSQQFKPLNLKITINVPLDNDSFDYQGLAQYSDYLIAMAYDEHWVGGQPGSISSMMWYQSGLQRLLTKVPTDKVIVALGNYGYDRSKSTKTADTLTFQEALTTMNESEGQVTFDPASLTPMFEYDDEKSIAHSVWYLDATTFYNQVNVGQDLNLDRYALRRLGSEDPSLWKLLQTRHIEENQKPSELESFGVGYDIEYDGSGEIYSVTQSPSDGQRKLDFDSGSDLVVGETITAFPQPYVITRMGGADNKKVVLTFDDGPSPFYTPQILDILKKYSVSAAFFVVGSEVEKYPDLLRKIFDNGNLIGNHSFTHPDVSQISSQRMEGELNTTQRLLESIMGRSTLLFRPPYGEDIEPEIPSEAVPLVRSTQLGYLNVGMKLDPNDWQSPGTGNIVHEILSQLSENRGHVVLLHDGGGDRSQTVEMLPTLIEALQRSGYQIVALNDLLGVPKDQLMPKLQGVEETLSVTNVFAYRLVNIVSRFIYYIFIFGLALGFFRLSLIGVMALRQARLKNKRKFDSAYQPKVSVIIPAYNEGKVVLKTIHSLFQSTYTNFDIIVVDDGSKDDTYQICNDLYRDSSQVKILTKPNGGKSSAINFGAEHSDAEIIIVLDADTIFDNVTIAKLVRHFQDPKVGAVPGNVKVGNRLNLVTQCQALEYITSQNLDRRAYDVLNAITVVPGAIGARRKSLITKLGGFKSDTLTEDADLTIEILRAGYRIPYEDEAIAYTEAPDTIKTFLKQRFRWSFGMLQTTFKHADVLFDPNASRGMRFFVIPNMFVYQIVFPLIAPLIDLIALLALLFLIFNISFSGAGSSYEQIIHILFYYVVFLVIDGVITILAFKLEKKEQFHLTLLFPVQRLLYRLLYYFVNLKALRVALTGNFVGRNKLERKNTVKIKTSNP